MVLTRIARVRLARLFPPWPRTVEVESLTVGRFFDLSALYGEKVAKVLLAGGTFNTTADLIRTFTEDDFCTLAATLCPREDRRFYRRHLWPPRNIVKLIQAMEATNDLERIVRRLMAAGGDGQRLTIDEQVTLVAMKYGISPEDVEGWYVDKFLDRCESLAGLLSAENGTPDVIPDRRASAEELGAIGGIAVVH